MVLRPRELTTRLDRLTTDLAEAVGGFTIACPGPSPIGWCRGGSRPSGRTECRNWWYRKRSMRSHKLTGSETAGPDGRGPAGARKGA